MADDDDDKIVVCYASLTMFRCLYLSANMACSHGLYKIRPTQQTVNPVVYLLKTQITGNSATPVLYLPRNNQHKDRTTHAHYVHSLSSFLSILIAIAMTSVTVSSQSHFLLVNCREKFVRLSFRKFRCFKRV